MGGAIDAGAAVIFVVWNNRGYREIETSMLEAGPLVVLGRSRPKAVA